LVPSNYSLSEVLLKSTLDAFMKGEGKTVLRPDKIKTMWIHWPPSESIATGYRHVELDSTKNFFFHPRYWLYKEKPTAKRRKVFRNAQATIRPNLTRFDQIFRERQQAVQAQLLQAEKSFRKFIKDENLTDIYDRLNISIVYDRVFADCFTDIIDPMMDRPINEQSLHPYCPTSSVCQVPRLVGVECTLAHSHHRANTFRSFRIYDILYRSFRTVHNGCIHV
uniref:Glycosyltransferase family 92 protein n=1 Tax=Anisakis simplex TaxID=6269 RepID=A0A0M3KHH3_ANISI